MSILKTNLTLIMRTCATSCLFILCHKLWMMLHTYITTGTVSTIDLVLMTMPSQLIKCGSIPPLFNSDHNGLEIAVKWRSEVCTNQPRRMIWRYAHANWSKANNLIRASNWESFMTDDVSSLWLTGNGNS